MYFVCKLTAFSVFFQKKQDQFFARRETFIAILQCITIFGIHLKEKRAFAIIGHEELCDYCPNEFQDDVDEEDEGFKRHHRHRHHFNNRAHAQHASGERRHPKDKKPTAKPSGDYEIDQSERLQSTRSHHRQHHQQYNDNKLGMGSDELHSTGNPESDNYAEYNFDDSKMTVEDNGKSDKQFLFVFSFLAHSMLGSSFACFLFCWKMFLEE